MSANMERENLLVIWRDVNESLDIMKGFEKGEISKQDARKRAKQGSAYLARALRSLGKMTDMPEL